jgi:hypothetical protein
MDLRFRNSRRFYLVFRISSTASGLTSELVSPAFVNHSTSSGERFINASKFFPVLAHERGQMGTFDMRLRWTPNNNTTKIKLIGHGSLLFG